jgi:hypothetical protein
MDYRMPKLNGATACRNIFSKDPAARIILVSGWSPSDEASASGAIAMLPKPVSLEQLQAALQSVAETLPALSPAEMPIPEISSQQDSLDYFQPVPQPLAVVPPSLEMSLHVDPPPNDQPDSIDYFQPVPQPLPVVPPSEMSFHVDTFPISAPVPQNELQPIMNAGPPNGKKNRRRRNARGTQRSGVR